MKSVNEKWKTLKVIVICFYSVILSFPFKVIYLFFWFFYPFSIHLFLFSLLIFVNHIGTHSIGSPPYVITISVEIS